MSSDMIFLFLDLGVKILDKLDWEDVKETARFYYTDSTTTVNLYPALILSVILLFFCKCKKGNELVLKVVHLHLLHEPIEWKCILIDR